MSEKEGLLLAYYGDDFTGSTDALEFLNLAGITALLFLKAPEPEHLKKFPRVQAIGLAGTTRSMNPSDMERALHPAFQAIKALHPRHVHYKICSTFDSSPEIGSIGKAIDMGAEVFASESIPLLVAAPDLGRYCTFGNLFARMGIGSTGSIYRLDRHPAMSRHPVTPACESDLRLHLAKQTDRPIGLFDILDLELPVDASAEKLHHLIRKGSKIILFDALYSWQMATIGALLETMVPMGKPLFSVGSSGIEKALGDHWVGTGKLKEKTSWPKPGKKGPLLVVSGSCSPVTAGQIAWAKSQGFVDVAVGASVVKNDESAQALIETYVSLVSQNMKEGRNVIIHTCLGPGDPRMGEVNELINNRNEPVPSGTLTAKIMGKSLGLLVNRVLEIIPVQRLVIAGGDTSGYLASELGIEAIEMIAPMVKGAPLCRVHAPGLLVDGMEINFKGGQVGDEKYFETVLNGQ